eukprot:g3934.t1
MQSWQQKEWERQHKFQKDRLRAVTSTSKKMGPGNTLMDTSAPVNFPNRNNVGPREQIRKEKQRVLAEENATMVRSIEKMQDAYKSPGVYSPKPGIVVTSAGQTRIDNRNPKADYLLKRPKTKYAKHPKEWQPPRASDLSRLEKEKKQEIAAKKRRKAEKSWQKDAKEIGLKREGLSPSRRRLPLAEAIYRQRISSETSKKVRSSGKKSKKMNLNTPLHIQISNSGNSAPGLTSLEAHPLSVSTAPGTVNVDDFFNEDVVDTPMTMSLPTKEVGQQKSDNNNNNNNDKDEIKQTSSISSAPEGESRNFEEVLMRLSKQNALISRQLIEMQQTQKQSVRLLTADLAAMKEEHAMLLKQNMKLSRKANEQQHLLASRISRNNSQSTVSKFRSKILRSKKNVQNQTEELKNLNVTPDSTLNDIREELRNMKTFLEDSSFHITKGEKKMSKTALNPLAPKSTLDETMTHLRRELRQGFAKMETKVSSLAKDTEAISDAQTDLTNVVKNKTQMLSLSMLDHHHKLVNHVNVTSKNSLMSEKSGVEEEEKTSPNIQEEKSLKERIVYLNHAKPGNYSQEIKRMRIALEELENSFNESQKKVNIGDRKTGAAAQERIMTATGKVEHALNQLSESLESLSNAAEKQKQTFSSTTNKELPNDENLRATLRRLEGALSNNEATREINNDSNRKDLVQLTKESMQSLVVDTIAEIGRQQSVDMAAAAIDKVATASTVQALVEAAIARNSHSDAAAVKAFGEKFRDCISSGIERALDGTVQRSLRSSLQHAFTEEIGGEGMNEELRIVFNDALKDALRDGVSTGLQKAVREGFNSALDEATNNVTQEIVQQEGINTLRVSMISTLKSSLDTTLQGLVKETLSDAVGETLKRQMNVAVRSKLEKSMQEAVASTMEESVDSAMQDTLALTVQHTMKDIMDKSLQVAVKECLHNAAETAISNSMSNSNILSRLGDTMGAAVDKAFASHIGENEIKTPAFAIVKKIVDSHLKIAVEKAAKDGAQDALAGAGSDRMASQVSARLTHAVLKEMSSAVDASLRTSLDASLQTTVTETVSAALEVNVKRRLQKTIGKELLRMVEISLSEGGPAVEVTRSAVGKAIDGPLSTALSSSFEEGFGKMMGNVIEGEFEKCEPNIRKAMSRVMQAQWNSIATEGSEANLSTDRVVASAIRESTGSALKIAVSANGNLRTIAEDIVKKAFTAGVDSALAASKIKFDQEQIRRQREKRNTAEQLIDPNLVSEISELEKKLQSIRNIADQYEKAEQEAKLQARLKLLRKERKKQTRKLMASDVVNDAMGNSRISNGVLSKEELKILRDIKKAASLHHKQLNLIYDRKGGGICGDLLGSLDALRHDIEQLTVESKVNNAEIMSEIDASVAKSFERGSRPDESVQQVEKELSTVKEKMRRLQALHAIDAGKDAVYKSKSRELDETKKILNDIRIQLSDAQCELAEMKGENVGDSDSDLEDTT